MLKQIMWPSLSADSKDILRVTSRVVSTASLCLLIWHVRTRRPVSFEIEYVAFLSLVAIAVVAGFIASLTWPDRKTSARAKV